MHPLRFRQIHLDFHTSPFIAGIGSHFDKKQWQETLVSGRVNSITCFAVCHHGWSYNETRIGAMHPHLKFDLLRAQYDACKEIGINVPVYLSAGVNNRIAEANPQWREIGIDGRYTGWARGATEAGFHKLCFNTPYLDYLCELIGETAQLFSQANGLFLDIVNPRECCCVWCLKSMHALGLNPDAESDRRSHGKIVLEKYYQRTVAAARAVCDTMPIFHNSGHIRKGDTRNMRYFSHLELESLPTGGWGYDHFPISAKYCRTIGLEFLGMTGKFHTTWGEFGGFKHPNALRYECAAMLAFGAKCSIGDQLHPDGLLDQSTYAIIGQAYAEVESKESYCTATRNCADIALLSCESEEANASRDCSPDIGAGRALLEGHFLFDVIDRSMKFGSYRLLVLPDQIRLDDELKMAIDAYLSAGGKLLLTGSSGMWRNEDRFALDIGATDHGLSPYSPDYILPVDALKPDFVSSPFVMYVTSRRITADSGTSLGDVYDPYFNRSYRHFCSHQHAPHQLQSSGFCCGVRKGALVYLAHPVFTLYHLYGAVSHKQYITHAIDYALADEKTLEIENFPSTARVTLTHQPAQQRYVLHLLYAATVTRGAARAAQDATVASVGKSVEVIEELLPLQNITITLKTPTRICRVAREPHGRPVEFSYRADGRITFVVDSFTCHQMIALYHA